jgi:hypothetical protein
MFWSSTPEIVILSVASSVRFSYAWYSSRCVMAPFADRGWNGLSKGACASAE